MRTLNGHPLNKLNELLDQPLPPQAYKAIPGGAGLTDIDAGWQRRAFNKIFGVYGLGWGFDFEHNQIDIRHEEVQGKNGARMAPFARVYGKFWFAYRDEMDRIQRIEFPVTGANSNSSGSGAEGYTLKGAITNAIGFGASMIGWQESVYLGARSHNNTEGFAEGKGYMDVEPETEPAPPASSFIPSDKKPEPPAVKKAGYCKDCLLVIEEPALPSVCKCGSREIVASTSRETAVSCVKKLKELKEKKAAPKPAETLPVDESLSEPAITEPPVTEQSDKSLAEKLNFQSIKHVVCASCGWAEPVNAMPPACPGCGDVKGPFEVESHAIMVSSSTNIKNKLQLKIAAAESKELLDRIKFLCNNDRGLILSTLTKAAGRDIKGYSECTPAEFQKALLMLPNEPAAAAPPELGKRTRPDLTKELFELAADLKLGGPRSVIAEIGKVAGKTVTSATQLDEKELFAVICNFKERIAGK